jgi:hypothetical protein
VNGAGGLLLRLALTVHAVASLAFWIAQPRGFAFLSRSFVEHQGVAPALFAVSAAGLAAIPLKRLRATWIAVGILGGFWTASAGVIAVVGSTVFARAFWVVLPAAAGLLVLAYRLIKPDPPGLLTGGTVVGVALAATFWGCTWAPPASTRPPAADAPLAPVVPEAADRVRLSVEGSRVVLQGRTGRASIWPAFEYDSVSDAGFWTVFQFRSSILPAWTWRPQENGSLELNAENEDFTCSALAWIQNGRVHVRAKTVVKREIASHLSTVMQLHLPGAAFVEGVPWTSDHQHERSEFIAIREGRTELLRASSREKGPFETLGSWELRDPVITIDGWKVQVIGWAAQGSREPSPTAGWGVSQAAIERGGDVYLWSLAATSIGRGWHSVRTAPGVYVLEAILTPPTSGW